MIITPLEQFQIISLLSLKLASFDFSVTNLLIVSLMTLLIFMSLISFVSVNSKYVVKHCFFVVPNNWQYFIELLYQTVFQLLFDNLNFKGQSFFPFVSVLFTFILLCNLIGLIPYSFTVTSHLIVTFTLSFSVFIGLTLIGIAKHRMNFLSLFIPSNTTFALALVLVPIEFISYIAKPISLGVRLFINLMAGHTLLKVIVGFAWSMLFIQSSAFISHLIPLLILVLLMGLELGVALIQAYVFTILVCIYLNDSLNLH